MTIFTPEEDKSLTNDSEEQRCQTNKKDNYRTAGLFKGCRLLSYGLRKTVNIIMPYSLQTKKRTIKRKIVRKKREFHLHLHIHSVQI